MMEKGRRGMVRTGTAALGATLMAIALAVSPVGATPFTGKSSGSFESGISSTSDDRVYIWTESLTSGYSTQTGAVQCRSHVRASNELHPATRCDATHHENPAFSDEHIGSGIAICQSEDKDGWVYAEVVTDESYTCFPPDCFDSNFALVKGCTATRHLKYEITESTGMYRDSAGSFTTTSTITYSFVPPSGTDTGSVENNTVGDLTLAGGDPPNDIFLDIPAQGSTQSGIGLVSGWSCLGGHLEVEFSEADGTLLSTWSLPHGADRGDTQEKCGDSENGFSMPFNWYHLGPGAKTLTVFVNGEERITRNFSVTTFGEEFITDAGGMCEIADFRDGQNATFVWEQANQGLVLESLN